MPTALSDLLGDRTYVSQYAIDPIGLEIRPQGILTDADGLVHATMTTLDYDPSTVPPTGSVVFSRDADHTDVGTYSVTYSSAATAVPGLWKVTWTYTLGGLPQEYVGVLEVGAASPAYDRLS